MHRRDQRGIVLETHIVAFKAISVTVSYRVLERPERLDDEMLLERGGDQDALGVLGLCGYSGSPSKLF